MSLSAQIQLHRMLTSAVSRITSFPAITDLAEHEQHLCLKKNNWLLDWGWGFSSSMYTAMQDKQLARALLCN